MIKRLSVKFFVFVILSTPLAVTVHHTLRLVHSPSMDEHNHLKIELAFMWLDTDLAQQAADDIESDTRFYKSQVVARN
jgi:hypothetical protein